MKYFNGQLIEETAEDLALIEADKAQAPITAAEDKAKEDEAKALKASARAKLMSGEALTEEEANTIVL
tara:strand:+ start:14 stop:217 length:204 start_codon:yes stop_codon:yes gene_type:complete